MILYHVQMDAFEGMLNGRLEELCKPITPWDRKTVLWIIQRWRDVAWINASIVGFMYRRGNQQGVEKMVRFLDRRAAAFNRVILQAV